MPPKKPTFKKRGLPKPKMGMLPRKFEKKKRGLFIKFVLEVEKKLPGATGNEKRAWVKQRLDDLIVLPPPFEQLSDFAISLGTDIAYSSVRVAEAKFLEDSEIDALKKELELVKDEYDELTERCAKAEAELDKLKAAKKKPVVAKKPTEDKKDKSDAE